MTPKDNLIRAQAVLDDTARAFHYMARHGASKDTGPCGFGECQAEECKEYKEAWSALSYVSVALNKLAELEAKEGQ